MSGIAGIYYLDGHPLDPFVLGVMIASIAHRGPDGAGSWIDGSVGLGHRMLWTTPESLRERLPMTKSGLTITADGRIDNREELIRTLQVDEAIGDSELILRAYETWGEHCAERLIGDFAFAVWDQRKQEMYCARDAMGVMPFYYHYSHRLFAFGSEIKAIFALTDVPRRLNEPRIADYLTSTFEDNVATFFKDVSRLPPGHCMRVGRDEIHIRKYWALDPNREIRLASNAEYADAFREIFTEAVRCRLRSAFPIGSMLSGGLDSSSIVCVARDLLHGERSLHTFSAVFDDVPECDERPYINAVLQQGDFEPHFVHGDRISPLAEFERVLFHQDQPPPTPNLFLHEALYSSAKSEGVRILLDGLDGDTTVSHGMGLLQELAYRGRWIRLAREIDELSRNFGVPRYKIARNLVRSIAPELAKKGWRSIRPSRRTMLRAELSAVRRLSDPCRSPRTAREEHWRRLNSPLLSDALEVVNHSSAAFSIQSRYPFFDKRLVEFCLALPGEQKMFKGLTRVVMRRGLAHTLPQTVSCRRGKSDLSSNFRRALLTFESSRIEEIIRHGFSGSEFIDVNELDRAYRSLQSGENRHAFDLWVAITLILWLDSIEAADSVYTASIVRNDNVRFQARYAQ